MKKNAEFVGVNDEYIPKNEKYVDESTFNDEKKEKFEKNVKKGGKIALGVYLGYIIFVALIAVLIIGATIFGFIRFSRIEAKIFDNFGNMINTIDKIENDFEENEKDKQEDFKKDMKKMNEKYDEGEEKVKKIIDEIENQINNN